MDAQHTPSAQATKRRRLQHDPDKKYPCLWEGCSKQYSRAEHLNRHMQNHKPKEIYSCPKCSRRFVRQDLRNRHIERHENNESKQVRDTKGKYDPKITLQETQETSNNQQPTGHVDDNATPPPDDNDVQLDTETQVCITSTSDQASLPDQVAKHDDSYCTFVNGQQHHQQASSAGLHNHVHDTQHTVSSFPVGQVMRPVRMMNGGFVADDHTVFETLHQQLPQSASQPPLLPPMLQQGSWNQTLGPVQHSNWYNSLLYYPGNQQQFSASNEPLLYRQPSQGPRSDPAYHRRPYSIQDSMEPFGTTAVRSSIEPISPMTANSSSSLNLIGRFTTPSTPSVNSSRPIFSNRNYKIEDLVRDDGSDSLDDAINVALDPFEPAMYAHGHQQPPITTIPYVLPHNNILAPRITASSPALVNDEQPRRQRSRLYEADVTLQRFTSFSQYVYQHFNDKRRHWVKIARDDFFERKQFHSPGWLVRLLSSFWNRIHPQIPILHQATFATDTCPDLLLAVILALGASCCDGYRDEDEREKATSFALFLTWHVRINIIQEPDCDPPAQLWVLQTMFLLEVYEKLFSTKLMHHNGESDHAQNVTRMRSGSSILGRCSRADMMVQLEDSTVEGPGARGTINAAGYNTDDPEWNEWISNEAIRRIAFAAFVLDTTHAHLFNHKSHMCLGDVGYMLPCSEMEWLATSYKEVQMIKHARSIRGFTDITFIAALKRTLANKEINVFSFGRTVVLAGLLSYSTNGNVKPDTSAAEDLGPIPTHNSFDKVTRGLKFWGKDFDEWLAEARPNNIKLIDKASVIEMGDDKLTEMRTVLLHFAHMAFNGELHHCQVFTDLSDKYGDADKARSRSELSAWAGMLRASDATFHAVKCLFKILLPQDLTAAGLDGAAIVAHYSAKDDYLFHRPYVVYNAAITIWAYTYFRSDESGHWPAGDLSTPQQQALHMRSLLMVMDHVEKESDLRSLQYHRTSCLGLLLFLAGKFLESKWELLREAADSLMFCASLSRGEQYGVKWHHMERYKRESVPIS